MTSKVNKCLVIYGSLFVGGVAGLGVRFTGETSALSILVFVITTYCTLKLLEYAEKIV